VTSEETLNNAIEHLADGISHLKILFVNAYFVETPETEIGSWVLVDTGMPKSGGKILRFADKLFGKTRKPTAIILTHGHLDHAGSALFLAEYWNVPIYAHRLEMPYLTGKSDYPPQDPTVGGPLAFMSRLLSSTGFDLRNRVQQISESGEILEMPGWQIIHTPGHTPGHISLFRKSDKTLLAGDALTTMNSDSWVSVLAERRGFHPPPAPFTSDWQAARRSVEILAELEPYAVGAGHGKPIRGAKTAQQLKELARNFTSPKYGRYINSPAISDESGVVMLPPPVPDPLLRVAVGASLGMAVGIGATALTRRQKPNTIEENQR
jgi:glyoxylase-like metal-dependent hydrolase (beta-lactamase superfamily II)